MSPFGVVRDFEIMVAEYTGAPYCVAVSSCSAALMLAVAWHLRNHKPKPMEMASPPFNGYELESLNNVRNRMYNKDLRPAEIEIPKHTYLSVPMSIIHAGGRPTFRDEEWLGAYQLKPLPVWDSARWFTSGLYRDIGRKFSYDETADKHIDTPGAGHMVCTSHHWNKPLGIEQGGCILHDDPEADAWLRRARFDGRAEGVAPKDDTGIIIGHHCYLSPSVAANGLIRLHHLPKHLPPMPADDYPDLSTLECFK